MTKVYRIRDKQTGKYLVSLSWGGGFRFSRTGRIGTNKETFDTTLRSCLKKSKLDTTKYELVEYDLVEVTTYPIEDGVKLRKLGNFEPRDIVRIKEKRSK